MDRRFYIETYGCQMNTADSALVERLLEEAGYVRVDTAEQADVVLLNTCTVRGRAAERVRGRFTSLLALRQERPELVLGMLGCLAQHQGEEIWRELPFLDIVAGPDSYRRLPELLEATWRGRGGHALDVRLDRRETYADLPAATRFPGASGFVTIQRGCDNFCAYCIVPLVRGRERAVPAATVVEQVRTLVASGYCELTLLGQTVNSYRDEGLDFAGLLRQVAAVPGLARLRFLSPHPVGFSDELIATLAELPNVMPALHLPVQSGSSRVLAEMGRGYGRDEYLTLVDKLRAAVPGLELTTDVLVGFPGESEADCEETISLLEAVRFQAAYLYRYSERAGTRAAHRLPDCVPEPEKLRRLGRVIEVQERITRELFASYCGREVELLVEGPSRRNLDGVRGHSRENMSVVLPEADGLVAGALVRVRVAQSTGHTLIARRLPD